MIGLGQLLTLPPEILKTINSYTYFPYIGYEKVRKQMTLILENIKQYKIQKLNILFLIDNFILPVHILLYRWLCLDINEDILNFIEHQINIDFDDTSNTSQFHAILDSFTHHHITIFHKFCIES
tara:strand:+ start:448 stop:819 length:372 start_codon:yes stop_codon:yes gene_type:complete